MPIRKMILKIAIFLSLVCLPSGASTVFFSSVLYTTATPTVTVEVAAETSAAATSTLATTTTEANPPTVTSATKQSVVPMKLRCSDKSNPNFAMPTYCEYTPSSGQLIVRRGASDAGFDEILPGAFDGMQLKQLVLSGLSIKTLHADSLSGLGELNNLNISNNQLTSLPDGIFSGLYKLAYLYLDSNQLSEIEADLLKDQYSLSECLFSNNQISTIADGAFKNQNLLNHLALDGNNLTELSRATFQGLNQLTMLNLAKNKIRTFDQVTFQYLTSLKELNISHNFVQQVPDFAVNFSEYLETLDLSFNVINDFSEKAFGAIRMLSYIYLNDNQLTSLKDTTFGKLEFANSLFLQNNRISGITSNTFAGLSQLQRLILKNNNIGYLPVGWLDAVGSLREVDLSQNVIDKIDDGPFETPKRMLKLDMSFNKLKKIDPKWFHELSQLTELRLRDNGLVNISSETFNIQLSQLTVLDLGQNELKQEMINQVFKNLKNLKFLYLDGNPLTAFDADSAGCQARLEELYLNKTCLEYIRVQEFKYLRQLDLEQNYLQSLTTAELSGLDRLERMDLSDNNITRFDFGSISASTGFKFLNLSMNMIQDIKSDNTFPAFFQQSTVDLSWNMLVDLSTFPMFGKFYLAGNPVKCSCSQLPNWKNLDSFADYSKTVCFSQTTPQFLACQLNSATCTASSKPMPSADWCAQTSPTSDFAKRPIVYKNSCKYPKPTILDFSVNTTQSGFTVKWNSTNKSSLKWFIVSWGQRTNSTSLNSTSDNATTEERFPMVFQTIVWDKTKDGSLSMQLVKSGLTVVCVETVPVYLSIPVDKQCSALDFTATVSETTPNKLFPMLTYILIAVGIFIVLLILIILIAVCLRRRKSKRLEKEQKEEEKRKALQRNLSYGSVKLDPDLPKDAVEHTDVSISMYESSG